MTDDNFDLTQTVKSDEYGNKVLMREQQRELKKKSRVNMMYVKNILYFDNFAMPEFEGFHREFELSNKKVFLE